MEMISGAMSGAKKTRKWSDGGAPWDAFEKHQNERKGENRIEMYKKYKKKGLLSGASGALLVLGMVHFHFNSIQFNDRFGYQRGIKESGHPMWPKRSTRST
jgi:hypothetical protein